jgi:translation initiation factor 5B
MDDELENQNQDQAEAQDDGKKALSKGQKKKLKKKGKDGEPEKGDQPGEEENKEEGTPTEKPKEEPKKDDKKDKPAEKKDDGKKAAKGKPMNAAAKMALQRQEEQKRLDDERKRIEDEIREKEEAEQRVKDEADRIQKEIDAKKKEEKDRKRNEIISQVGYKTPKELEKEAEMARKREDMMRSMGIQLDQAKEMAQPSKPASSKKPKKKDDQKKPETAQPEEIKQEEVKPVEEKPIEVAPVEKPKKVTTGDDWEAEAEDWEESTASDFKTANKREIEEAVPVKKQVFTKAKPIEEVKKEEKPKKEEKIEKPEEIKKKPKKGKEIVEDDVDIEDKKPKKKKKEKDADLEEPIPKKVEVEEEVQIDWSVDLGPSGKNRCPVICILGHVDTGKTKLLDKMRNTNVQEGEAGGITQQIGATFFPYEKLREEIIKLKDFYPVKLDVPGILVIDTPGHESFSNLRSRGHGLCDFAILVVDIMHGLEKQTLESMELLRFRKTPFVIALNKIDRMYGWKPAKDSSSYVTLQKQEKNAQLEFKDRLQKTLTELAEKGINAAVYYDNPDPYTWDPDISEPYISVVPTSAITGEGIPDLLGCVINLSQRIQRDRILRRDDEFKATVMEVKVIEGLGATIDVMLINGTIREGDEIIIAGYEGLITTHIRALLTPHPMKEMRVKNEYIHHKEMLGAMGIKICANDLEKALAGSELYIIKHEGDKEKYKEVLEAEILKIKKTIKLVDEGVIVAASTLGSLEALLQFFKTSKIPVAGICIGPVSKTEVIRAMKPLQIEEGEINKEYATILAFDVKILPDALDLAAQEGVKIFTANIIYHLFDQFTAYINDIKEERKQNEGKLAVFPCILKPVAFFNKKDPVVLGVDVVEGLLRLGTPICAYEKDKIRIGVVDSIEKEHKPLQVAKPSDGSIAIRIKGDTSIMAGRHFEMKDRLISIMSRESIDALKKYFRDDMGKNDWELVKKLKPMFNII